MLKKIFAFGFVVLVLHFAFPDIVKFVAVIGLLWLGASALVEQAQNKKLIWGIFSLVVVLVSFSFVFADFFQLTFVSWKEKAFAYDLELASDPEIVDYTIQRKVSQGLDIAKRNADSLDASLVDTLVNWSRKDPANAGVYFSKIVQISKSAEQRNESIKKFRQSVAGSSGYEKTISVKSTPPGKEFDVVADSLTRLDFVMNGGRTYKLVSDHPFKMKCSDGMFYDIPTELTWPITEAGVFVPIVLANQRLKLTITDVTDNM